MGDVHSKVTRSYNMSRVKGKNTYPEILVRKFLFANGIRYRLNAPKLPGKPDLVFPKYRKILFINGCFWHGHSNCKYFKLPKTRSKWWKEKIELTIINDSKNKTLLEALGWEVYTIWECELRKDIQAITLDKLVSQIKNGKED
ncbi:MAG: DNA mismatch endonuclease Vsr [Chitinophagales bacterium]|nr:DNA mismatch endonuclease Vsr [Chitinophagales bacterium]